MIDTNEAKESVWFTLSLADPRVAKVNPAYSFNRGSKYSFIPMENVGERFTGVELVSEKIVDSGGYTRFQKNDILFGKITPCTENGKVAFIDFEPLNGLGFASTEFIVFSPGYKIDPKFLFYALTSDYIHGLAVSLMEGTTGRQRVPVSIFKRRVQIQFPDQKPEQTAIAHILSKVDETITATQTTIKAAERLKKALMQNLLTGKLKPDGTWRTEEEFYVDEKFGKVPKGWSFIKWGKLIKLEYGKSLKGNKDQGNTPVFGTNGRIGCTDQALYENEGIIVGRKGAYREVHYSQSPFWVIDTAFYVVPKTHFNIYWAYLSLKQLDLNRFDSGSAIPSTNKKDVYFNRTFFPNDKSEQTQIAKIFLDLESRIEEKIQKTESLQKLKKALMQNLLTGKVRLSEEMIQQLNQEAI